MYTLSCSVNDNILFKICNTGTEMGTVMLPKMAIICRPHHKRAKNMKIWSNSKIVAQQDS